ncbi:MAG: TIGR03086 family metal-binding protein [Ilumatobacteraceae bacterium]
MDQVELLSFAVNELHREVAALEDSEMDASTNCDPWTVRRLASHALNNQLLWAGLVTGQHLVTVEDTMGAVPVDGDLAPYADDVAERSLAMWGTGGVLTATHGTPFGELPGSVVITFATIDALCHAWDLAASLGRPIEFPPEMIAAIADLVEATCTDPVRELGLIKGVASTPPDANATDLLMARAGRSRSY